MKMTNDIETHVKKAMESIRTRLEGVYDAPLNIKREHREASIYQVKYYELYTGKWWRKKRCLVKCLYECLSDSHPIFCYDSRAEQIVMDCFEDVEKRTEFKFQFCRDGYVGNSISNI